MPKKEEEKSKRVWKGTIVIDLDALADLSDSWFFLKFNEQVQKFLDEAYRAYKEVRNAPKIGK